MNVEDELRHALRAEDPGAAFTQRVLARAREERAGHRSVTPQAQQQLAGADARLLQEGGVQEGAVRHGGVHVDGRQVDGARVVGANVAATTATTATTAAAARRVRTTRWVAAGVAASLALAAAGAQWVQHRHYVAEGERARAQVLAALRITSEKLNLVHDKIVEPAEGR